MELRGWSTVCPTCKQGLVRLLGVRKKGEETHFIFMCKQNHFVRLEYTDYETSASLIVEQHEVKI